MIIVAWPADARDMMCCGVTQGSEDGMTTSINVGIDPVFVTKYDNDICTSHLSYFVCVCVFFLFAILLTSTPERSITDCPVLPASVQPFAQWSPFLSGFAFLCCIRYQVCGCLYSVFAVTFYLFMYLLITALCRRCEWYYISGECLATDLVTVSRI